MSIEPFTTHKLSDLSIEIKSDFKVTKKVLDQFIKNAKYMRYHKCRCDCHRCNILNMHKHNAITILSAIQCLECPCPPIRFNARELDILNSHTRIAYVKHFGYPYPEWLKNDKMFLDLVVKLTMTDKNKKKSSKKE